jgi:hypothetical protein
MKLLGCCEDAERTRKTGKSSEVEPISGPFSTTQTRKSLPCSWQSCRIRMAAESPLGPPPTMTTSKLSLSRGEFMSSCSSADREYHLGHLLSMGRSAGRSALARLCTFSASQRKIGHEGKLTSNKRNDSERAVGKEALHERQSTKHKLFPSRRGRWSVVGMVLRVGLC